MNSMSTNSSLGNCLMILATLSSGQICLPYDVGSYFSPKIAATYNIDKDLSSWQDEAFAVSSGYTILNEDSERLQIIINFSKKLIEKSANLDSEYVDIVNDNFWSLI